MMKMTRFSGTSVPLKACMLLLASSASAPAFADHTGPTGVGTGASLNVLSPDTLVQGHASAGLRVTYTQPAQRSDETLADLAGDHVHAHNTDYNLNAAVGIAYGITDRLTLSAELPYVHRDDLREGEHSHVDGQVINEVVRIGSVSGIGDLSVLAKYKLVDGGITKFALIGGLKAPTGSTHRKSDEGERLETEHQPGSGSWDPLIGAAFGAELGALNLNASALYQFSGKGVQDTGLGDRAQGGVSLSHHFGPPEQHHEEAPHEHRDGAELEHAEAEHGHSSWDAFVELTGEWEGRQKVDGEIELASGGKSIWLSPGVRFNSAGAFSVAAAFGLPVWQDIRESHPDNDYRLSFVMGKGF
jgi:hypothetical protein